ncbi:MAG: hypothetical protein ACYC1E_08625 [Propionibacteriaceae bacterium]
MENDVTADFCMNVSIEPVPEFTAHEPEPLVAVPVDSVDPAALTCGVRSCGTVVVVDADGEVTGADAVAEPVAPDAAAVVVAVPVLGGRLGVDVALGSADAVVTELAPAAEAVAVVTADCACATWVVPGSSVMAIATAHATRAVSQPRSHVFVAAGSTKRVPLHRPGPMRRARREG